MLKKIYKSICKSKYKKSIEENCEIYVNTKLKCHFKSICKSKAGNFIEEYEDSIFVPSENEVTSETILKFAISDGAAESSYAKDWSKLLVNNYRDKLFDKDNFQKTIHEISEELQLIVNSIKLNWYAEEKFRYGAFATFLGLKIDLQECKWESIAVGDSTLFYIRENKLLTSFPIQSSKEYGNTPNLISSGKNIVNDFDSLVSLSSGEIISGDLILIGTDAISEWILEQVEIGEMPWKQLEIFFANDFDEFEIWLNQERNIGKIKNDDTTLIILKFE